MKFRRLEDENEQSTTQELVSDIKEEVDMEMEEIKIVEAIDSGQIRQDELTNSKSRSFAANLNKLSQNEDPKHFINI